MNVLSSASLQSLPQHSFVGCLRNFRLNSKLLDSPSARFGVSPCSGGSLEKGIYFSQEGGHVALGKEQLAEFMSVSLKNSVFFP